MQSIHGKKKENEDIPALGKKMDFEFLLQVKLVLFTWFRLQVNTTFERDAILKEL